MYMFFYKHDVYKHLQAQVRKQINYLCISYVLFVDIFPRSFDDFISMKFLITVFLPASCLFQPPGLLTLVEIFANLPVYCTIPVYYFGQNSPASLFIPSSPSISNPRVLIIEVVNFQYQPMVLMIQWCSRKKNSFNFSKAKTKFCFSLHYNSDETYLYVNKRKACKFKANDNISCCKFS